MHSICILRAPVLLFLSLEFHLREAEQSICCCPDPGAITELVGLSAPMSHSHCGSSLMFQVVPIVSAHSSGALPCHIGIYVAILAFFH